MTRDEIYDHLAQVYLGKKKNVTEKKKKRFNAWLLINIVITLVIFSSAVYGLTAFLAQRSERFQNKIFYALHNGPLRVPYNLNHPYPPVKTFSLEVPRINAAKYQSLEFSIRGLEEGAPGIVRVEVRNQKDERSSVVVENVRLDWRQLNIPLADFKEITDWTNLTEVSFILEQWNAERKEGIILIDGVCFSS